MIKEIENKKEKKDRREYMKSYHEDKQKNDKIYKEKKALNSKRYYHINKPKKEPKMNDEDYEFAEWLEDLRRRSNIEWEVKMRNYNCLQT